MTGQPDTRTEEGAMERSGLGLLPGMCLAMLIGVVLIMAVLIGQWWVVPVVFLALVILAGVVTAILFAVMEDEGEESKLRRYIPGL